MDIKEIKPFEGLGEIKFGMTRNQVKKILGEPDETEKYPYTEGEDDLTESWHYDEYEISFGFDEEVDWKLMTIAVSSTDYIFKGMNLLGLKRDLAMNTFAELGLKNLFIEDSTDEDNLLSVLVCSEETGMNFWFEDDVLSEIQWGPEFIDEETIRWPE
jgi:hypothetical protein